MSSDHIPYDYGYGELENRLIEVFQVGPPDFAAAGELLRQGADLNAVGRDDEENILSEILSGYVFSANPTLDHFREHAHRPNPEPGRWMCDIIRFFLNHGFDVTKRDDCFGAQCLRALTLSTYDRYMLNSLKLLLDAGAKNRTVSPTASEYETPQQSIVSEESYQWCCEHDYALSNVFEAAYQIYQAAEEGRPYHGIDSYEAAVGKKIRKVLAEPGDGRPVFFSTKFPGFKEHNCFTSTLYFVYDGGVLIASQHCDFWTDTCLPDAGLVDVSGRFKGIVGNRIQQFSYQHRAVINDRTHFNRPITTIRMDSGHRAAFSTNFGLVENEDLVAYFNLFPPSVPASITGEKAFALRLKQWLRR
ncbi:MAG: hypothetical protein E7429_06105 [Ruminococcaceae bacterium]|nr:hypothetical protein [Oscillospiraceae bacterium]